MNDIMEIPEWAPAYLTALNQAEGSLTKAAEVMGLAWGQVYDAQR